MPIKLTSTLEDDLVVKIIKVKPGLYIKRKDRKNIWLQTCLLSFRGMSPGLHIVVSDCSVHISQEIFANDICSACSAIVTTIRRPGLRFRCHC